MGKSSFFLNSNVAESVLIISIILATKFYMESDEVVVNCDIARLLFIKP